MPKHPPDILARMPPALRIKAIGAMVAGVFGPKNAPRALRQITTAMTSKARQPGDHPDPEKNHWQGAWRIYEIE